MGDDEECEGEGRWEVGVFGCEGGGSLRWEVAGVRMGELKVGV